TLHPFRIACIVRFFLLVEFGFIFLPIDFPPCNDFRAVASVISSGISSGDRLCSLRVTSSPCPHPLGVLSSSLFDSHLKLFTIILRCAPPIVPLLLSTQQSENDMNGHDDARHVRYCSCFSLHRSDSPGSHLHLA